MGALGAVLHTMKADRAGRGFPVLEAIEANLERREPWGEKTQREPLTPPAIAGSQIMNGLCPTDRETGRAYLGIDMGSVSTNLVVIDDRKQVLAKRYLRTRSEPLEAVRQGLRAIAGEFGESVGIAGVGADVVRAGSRGSTSAKRATPSRPLRARTARTPARS